MVAAWRRQSQHWRSPVDVLGRGIGRNAILPKWTRSKAPPFDSHALSAESGPHNVVSEDKGLRIRFSRGRERVVAHSILRNLLTSRLEETAASNVSAVPPVSASTSHSARREVLFSPLFRGTRQSRSLACISAFCVPRPPTAGLDSMLGHAACLICCGHFPRRRDVLRQ